MQLLTELQGHSFSCVFQNQKSFFETLTFCFPLLNNYVNLLLPVKKQVCKINQITSNITRIKPL